MSKTDTTVGQLVDMIQRGDLRLPEMQRRYVWTSTRVRDAYSDDSGHSFRPDSGQSFRRNPATFGDSLTLGGVTMS